MDNGESKRKTTCSKAKQRVRIIIDYKQFLFGNDNDSREKKKKRSERENRLPCPARGVYIRLTMYCLRNIEERLILFGELFMKLDPDCCVSLKVSCTVLGFFIIYPRNWPDYNENHD